MHALILVILGLAVIIAASLAEIYSALPLVELKRRARGDRAARAIYQVASYRVSSQVVLWVIVGICASLFFILVTKSGPVWVALVASAALIWIALAWVPRSSVNSLAQAMARFFAAPYVKLLHYLQPLFRRFDSRAVAEHPRHTLLFEKDDVLRLFNHQLKQADNRISAIELDMLSHVLLFNDKKVADLMVPSDRVKAVKVEERLGPVVLDELHKTGLSYFPVYELRKANIIGVLNLTSIESRKSELVKSVMDQPVCYIHENQTLNQALAAFIKTNQLLLVVINDNADYLGVLALKQVLTELVGSFIVDEFDHYDNKAEVAHGGLRPASDEPQPNNGEAELVE
jgi:CBS domain containing-hemolysin-like protein